MIPLLVQSISNEESTNILPVPWIRLHRCRLHGIDRLDDAAALSAAKQLTDKHDVEVWDCGRLVARLSPGGEVMSPELVPSLIFAPPSQCEENSVEPAEPISLSRVSELAVAASSETNPFL